LEDMPWHIRKMGRRMRMYALPDIKIRPPTAMQKNIVWLSKMQKPAKSPGTTGFRFPRERLRSLLPGQRKSSWPVKQWRVLLTGLLSKRPAQRGGKSMTCQRHRQSSKGWHLGNSIRLGCAPCVKSRGSIIMASGAM